MIRVTIATEQNIVPARPTRVRFQILAAACSLAVITYIHRVGFATASAEIKEPLGLSDQHLGYMMAAFLIGYGLFEMPWGLLGDRLGVRNILMAIILGGSVLTACLPLVVVLPRNVLAIVTILMIVRFLFGAFQAGTFPSISRMMADWMPMTERGRAQGAIWMASRTGGALAPILLVWLFAVIGDWKTPLILVALLGLAWAVCFWPWFRNLPEETPRVNREERRLIESGRPDMRPRGPQRDSLGSDASNEKRVGLVLDVRFPRLQRQLLHHALANLLEAPPESQLGRHGSTHVITLRVGCRRVFRGRFVLRCGDPALGKAMGPPHRRRGRDGCGGAGDSGRSVGG